MYKKTLLALFISATFSSSAFAVSLPSQPDTETAPTNSSEHGADYISRGDDSYSTVDQALDAASIGASNANALGVDVDLNRVDSVTDSSGQQKDVVGVSLDTSSVESGVSSSQMVTVAGGNGFQTRGHGEVTMTRDITHMNTTHDVTGATSVDANYEAHRTTTISANNKISRETEITMLNDDGAAQETYQVTKSKGDYFATNADGEVYSVINQDGEVRLEPSIDASKYTRNELQTTTYLLNMIDSNISDRVDGLLNNRDTGAWVQLNYTSGKQGGSVQHADTNSSGVTIGYDIAVNPSLTLGSAFTYAENSSDYQTQPDSSSDNYSFTVYAYNTLVNDLFLEANGTYAYSNYDMDDVQDGNPNGNSFNTRLALGNNFDLNGNGNLVVRGVFNFSRATMDSYYLDDSKYDANDLDKTEIGVSAHYEDSFTLSNKAQLIPSVSVSYMYNLTDNENYTTLSGGDFIIQENVYGENDNNRVNSEVGLSYVAGAVESKLSWNHLNNGDYKDDSVNINLSYSFK